MLELPLKAKNTKFEHQFFNTQSSAFLRKMIMQVAFSRARLGVSKLVALQNTEEVTVLFFFLSFFANLPL